MFSIILSLSKPKSMRKPISLKLKGKKLEEVPEIHAQPGDVLEWNIALGQDILDFKITAKDPKAKYPFEHSLSRSMEPSASYVVKPTTKGFKWEYNIVWTDLNQQEHTLDPIIVIDPTKEDS